jgi:hypothetical protein
MNEVYLTSQNGYLVCLILAVYSKLFLSGECPH